jgi:hypothetical protein
VEQQKAAKKYTDLKSVANLKPENIPNLIAIRD